MDDEQRYQAAAAKEARFDGVFFTAVRTTGIYCRPSCPAITPKRSNVTFYPTAAAAQQAGYRACKRCRPDASPGSPEWNVRSDVAGRAMRLIADGIVDRDGVPGLADRLGYSPRQVGRVLAAEVGAGPLALARAQRARTARVLVETSALAMGDIAFAAGFSSIRQFNSTMLEVYDTPPSVLRERAERRGARASGGGRGGRGAGAGTGAGGPAEAVPTGALCLRLPFRPPIDLPRLLGFLAARAVPGVEVVTATEYRRTLSLPNGPGVARLRIVPGQNWVECVLALTDLRDVTAAVQRCRRLLDLDADPLAISGYLACDPVIGPLARACQGRRSIGAVDGDEIALRAVLGQQVSVAAARRLAGQLAVLAGRPLQPAPAVSTADDAETASAPAGPAGPAGAAGADEMLTHLFPDAATVAGLDPETLPMPRARGRALVGLAEALASGAVSLDPGADREETAARLLALPGIGPWTVGYIGMRALSDPDAFPAGDVGVLRALGLLGHPAAAASMARAAQAWRPWRSYAVQHLWATLESAATTEEMAS